MLFYKILKEHLKGSTIWSKSMKYLEGYNHSMLLTSYGNTFSVHRCDRSLANSDKKDGAGVLAAGTTKKF